MHLVHTVRLYRFRLNLDPSWGNKPSPFSDHSSNGSSGLRGKFTYSFCDTFFYRSLCTSAICKRNSSKSPGLRNRWILDLPVSWHAFPWLDEIESGAPTATPGPPFRMIHARGRQRIILKVDSLGSPSIEKLDSTGNAISRNSQDELTYRSVPGALSSGGPSMRQPKPEVRRNTKKSPFPSLTSCRS